MKLPYVNKRGTGALPPSKRFGTKGTEMLLKLLVGIVGGIKIYFDFDGRLYEKHPILSHYNPTSKFVYEEYGYRDMRMQYPEFVHVGYCSADYITYDIKDGV